MLENNPWGLPKTLVLTDVRNYSNTIAEKTLEKGFVIASKGFSVKGLGRSSVVSTSGYHFHTTYDATCKESQGFKFISHFNEVKRKLAYNITKHKIGKTLVISFFKELNYYNLKGMSVDQFKRDIETEDLEFILLNQKCRYSSVAHFRAAAIGAGWISLGPLGDYLFFVKGEKA
jgi:hypothetical protein